MVKTFVAAGVMVAIAAGSAAAQTAPRPVPDEQVRVRQRISRMEVVLAQAVSHGAENVLRQISVGMPERPMLNSQPQVRGFRLEGTGVIFYVQVPGLIMPVMWPVWQMATDTDSRYIRMTLQKLRTDVLNARGEERDRLQRTIRDLEQVLAESSPAAGSVGRPRVSAASLSPTAPAPAAAGVPPAIAEPSAADDPEAAYTREVKSALVDAMLENSQALGIGPDEWLVVAAGDNQPRNAMFPGDGLDLSTWIAKVRGGDLAALRAGTLTMEDARARVIVTEE